MRQKLISGQEVKDLELVAKEIHEDDDQNTGYSWDVFGVFADKDDGETEKDIRRDWMRECLILRRLHGTTGYERFGWAVAFGDLDGDKKAELVCGAPFHSQAFNGRETGAVFVFAGNSSSAEPMWTRIGYRLKTRSGATLVVAGRHLVVGSPIASEKGIGQMNGMVEVLCPLC